MTRRTETDSKGERRKVCLFFVSLCLAWQLWSLSLSFSLQRCLSASFSLYQCVPFVFISEIPRWWFSLLILFKLPAWGFTCLKFLLPFVPSISICFCAEGFHYTCTSSWAASLIKKTKDTGKSCLPCEYSDNSTENSENWRIACPKIN